MFKEKKNYNVIFP